MDGTKDFGRKSKSSLKANVGVERMCGVGANVNEDGVLGWEWKKETAAVDNICSPPGIRSCTRGQVGLAGVERASLAASQAQSSEGTKTTGHKAQELLGKLGGYRECWRT